MRGDILPWQIPAQGTAVGAFTHAARRDALPPSDRKGVTEETQSSFFILSFFFFFSSPLLSVFLSPSHVPKDRWMQGSERLRPQPSLGASPALSQPKGAHFFQGAVSGFPTPQPEQLSDGARSVRAFQCLCPGLEMDKYATTFCDIFL